MLGLNLHWFCVVLGVRCNALNCFFGESLQVFHALDDSEEGFDADLSDDNSNADEDDTFRPARPGRGRGGGSRRRCVQVRTFLDESFCSDLLILL